MADPVVAGDGESYERGAMEAWLEENGAVSPATGAPLPSCQLVTNLSLCRQLQASRL